MLSSLVRYIKGYVKIRVIGYSPERFINACRYRNIIMWGLAYRKGFYEMYITIPGLRKLKPVIRKTGTKVTIIGRFGLPFFFNRYRKRKIFFIGALGSIFLILFLSMFLWNINITGNISYSDEMIVECLNENDIFHGMLKRKIDCSQIVKMIRKKYDDIIWVSASVKGTNLYIQIKENETYEQEKKLQDEEQKKISGGSDIVSTENSIVQEIITRKGVPLVEVGTEVKKGDILVTGLIEVINDNKELIGYQIENSQADIRGLLENNYENKKSMVYEEKNYLEPQKEEVFFRIGKKLFWIGSKKNRFKRSESILNEKQVCLMNGFYIPIWYGHKLTKPYQSRKQEYTKEEIQKILSNDFHKYCENLEKKGVEIIENSVKIYTKRNFAIAKGTLTIICDIGENKAVVVPDLPMEENINGND